MTDLQTATPPTENELEGLFGLSDDLVREVWSLSRLFIRPRFEKRMFEKNRS